MQRTPEKILSTWLTKLNIRVSPILIKEQLKSHPDYPSLLSITDTLDELRIENFAFKIEKEQLHEVDTPFLAHLTSNGGEFVIAENRDTLEKVYPRFFETWDGIVLVAEKPAIFNNKENNQALQKEKKSNDKQYVTIASVILVSALATGLSTNWVVPALIAVAAVGIFISWLIVSKDLGIENKVADQVCGKETDCNEVIHSAFAKLPFSIGWSDIGLVWFTSLFLVLVMSSFAGIDSALLIPLSLLSVALIPFTFFSIYYQWRVIKKWCRLCMIILGLIWLQFVILFNTLIHYTWQVPQMKPVLFIATMILLAGITWFFIKKLIQHNITLEEGSFEGIRLKRNEDVFTALLEKGTKVDFARWENDLQLGNADAALQITVACNPYCGPCAVVHEKLHDFIEKNADKAGLTIRFTVNTKNKESIRTKAVQYILQHIIGATRNMNPVEKAGYTRAMLYEWYQAMNYDQFIEKYPFAEQIDVDDILDRNEEWIMKSKIAATPTIFINGKQNTQLYNVDELLAVLKNFITGATVYNVVEV